jgi:hypothetical protein
MARGILICRRRQCMYEIVDWTILHGHLRRDWLVGSILCGAMATEIPLRSVSCFQDNYKYQINTTIMGRLIKNHHL